MHVCKVADICQGNNLAPSQGLRKQKQNKSFPTKSACYNTSYFGNFLQRLYANLHGSKLFGWLTASWFALSNLAAFKESSI